MTRYRIFGPTAFVAAVSVLSAADPSAAADQAIVRGRIEAIDPPTRHLTVQTTAGDDLKLMVDNLSRLTVDGKKVTIDQLPRGRRVRVTFEKAGTANRVVSLRTPVPVEADLSRDVREAIKTAGAYSHDKKEEFEKTVQGVIDDVDDRIDDLRVRAKAAGAEAKGELNEQIRELQQKRDELGRRLDRARPAARDAWNDLKAGVSGAAEDLGRALDRFRDRSK